MNNFFPDTSETLEVFGASQTAREPSESNPTTDFFASSTPNFVPHIDVFQNALLPSQFEKNTFPTLIPTEVTAEASTVVFSEAPKRRYVLV